MKKKYALGLAVVVAAASMAFRPSAKVETNAEVVRVKEATFSQQIAKIKETKWTPLAVAALNVDCKVLVVTAVAAVTRLVDSESLLTAGKYKDIQKDIDMHSLDKNK